MEHLKLLSWFLAYNCYRNSEIETIHAGIRPYTAKGDFSDVKVITPKGEIPWNEVSKITDEEMCELNKDIVNRIYTVLKYMEENGGAPIGPFTMPSGWDEPKEHKDMVKFLNMVTNKKKAG